MVALALLVSAILTANAGESNSRSFLSVSDVAGTGTRHPYPSSIRSISIVMAAYNEHEYVAKTVESIQETTPAELLKEIIVVDDGSDPPMSTDLTNHPDVKVIRHDTHTGLIQSKVDGGNAARGDMIMFLDAHVKPEKDWYKPLLEHMNSNYKRVVVPVIPKLNGTTWNRIPGAVGYKMMFDWDLSFHWFDDGNDEVPCMSGGLFGITRQWWHESGEYDYGMKMWGGENIEQSVRVWLCGGEIHVARNSFISHVFRQKFPYKVNNTEVYMNKVRTVETWFDDYKQKFYDADAYARQHKAELVGDISERLALKRKLHCKPFKWFVKKFKKVFESKKMIPENTPL